MRPTWLLPLLAALVVVLAGCYAPSYGPGKFRCAKGSCPEGFVCNAAKECVHEGTKLDVAQPDAPRADAAPDGEPDIPNNHPCTLDVPAVLHQGGTSGNGPLLGRFALARELEHSHRYVAFVHGSSSEGPELLVLHNANWALWEQHFTSRSWGAGAPTPDGRHVALAVRRVDEDDLRSVVAFSTAEGALAVGKRAAAKTIVTGEGVGEFPTVVFGDADASGFAVSHPDPNNAGVVAVRRFLYNGMVFTPPVTTINTDAVAAGFHAKAIVFRPGADAPAGGYAFLGDGDEGSHAFVGRIGDAVSAAYPVKVYSAMPAKEIGLGVAIQHDTLHAVTVETTESGRQLWRANLDLNVTEGQPTLERIEVPEELAKGTHPALAFSGEGEAIAMLVDGELWLVVRQGPDSAWFPPLRFDDTDHGDKRADQVELIGLSFNESIFKFEVAYRRGDQLRTRLVTCPAQ